VRFQPFATIIMINYFNLPSKFELFIKKFDYVSLAHNKQKHDYVKLSTRLVLNEYGNIWFKKKGFKLQTIFLLFRIPKNFIGHIHYDNVTENHSKYGFNYVLDGQGIMQWVDDRVYQDIDYVNNKTVKDCFITDSWNGNMALVRTNTLHRVVNIGNTDRYVASFRTVDNSYPNSFEDACSLLSR
jgi:hypothetical protein